MKTIISLKLCISACLFFYSTETDPSCSSPKDRSDADKQAKQNQDNSGEGSPMSPLTHSQLVLVVERENRTNFANKNALFFSFFM